MGNEAYKMKLKKTPTRLSKSNRQGMRGSQKKKTKKRRRSGKLKGHLDWGKGKMSKERNTVGQKPVSMK